MRLVFLVSSSRAAERPSGTDRRALSASSSAADVERWSVSMAVVVSLHQNIGERHRDRCRSEPGNRPHSWVTLFETVLQR